MSSSQPEREQTEPFVGFSFSGATEPTTPVPSAVSREEAVGALPERVGPYPVLERLGVGGMGDVLLGYDERLSRKLAIKRIRPDRLDDEEVCRRFEIEARVTARLQHPSVLPVYHYVEGGESYYTMRPIEGITLAQMIAALRNAGPEERETWPTQRIVRLFLQAANAIAYAHSRGVIHRDLKPSNIMIGPFEEVIVLDWGMTKLADEAQTEAPAGQLDPLLTLDAETASRVLVGTPAYMAPEQFRLQPASEKTDQFALGLILYELLALRPPWNAGSITELATVMRTPPVLPTRIQPSRHIPHRLARVVLVALSHDPEDRYETVAEFARAVARALEGRVAWRVEATSQERRRWKLGAGRISAADGAALIRSRGNEPFRYFFLDHQVDDVRVEMDVCPRGTPELAVHLSTALGADGTVGDCYQLEVLPGRRRTLGLARAGRSVAGARSPSYARGRWVHVVASRERGTISLVVDEEEVYRYSDPIPLAGGFLGMTGTGELLVRDLVVKTRGASATVSCLAVPDSFFNRRLFTEALAEYERIATSLPGRREGRLAQFRAGLCQLELAELEGPELRVLQLEETRERFGRWAADRDSALADLGLAMVADRSGDLEALTAALRGALESRPDDPDRDAVVEWLLGRLHALDVRGERRQAAALLPLALTHGMEGWGRRLVGDLVRSVRHDWETPSFFTGRGRFRGADPVCRAEANMFLGFWADRADDVVGAVHALVAGQLLRPHHLTDAVFCLLELGRTEAAGAALARARAALGGERDTTGGKLRAAWMTCDVAIQAADGALEEAASGLQRLAPDPTSRPFNSARLHLARSAHALGERSTRDLALRRVGPDLRRAESGVSPRDYFAREHRAWFALLDGDAERARTELAPMVERGDHRSGKSLAAFLHGVSLAAAGDERAAQSAFAALPETPWPRTWTLGAYALSGRLDASFLERALPYERRCLERQLGLWAVVTGGDADELLAAL